MTEDKKTVTPVQSPWSLRVRFGILLWELTWILFCRWTPKPLNRWRIFWLRIFGANVMGKPFVHQRARIQIPWNLTIHEQACLGDRANIYSLGQIEIGEGSIIAQEAYLCSGTHDFSDLTLPLVTLPVVIGKNVFIGARAFIMPGLIIQDGAIVGACSVVTHDIGPGETVAGNPARPIRHD